MLSDSIRNLLNERWPIDDAVERSQDAGAVGNIWSELASQGLATLGAEPDVAGMREVLVVFEALGRASCPAPLLGAFVANYTLRHAVGSPSSAVHELLESVHEGKTAFGVAMGGFDGDHAAGRTELDAEGTLRGNVAFVESGLTASHYVVLVDSPYGVAIVSADAPGLVVEATPGLAVPALSQMHVASTVVFVELPKALLIATAIVARLACAARALGSAQRAFELAVEHAKVRRQFGQLIGQFQAIQHKLADCLTGLDGSRLLIENAADAHDRDDASWTLFAASAIAFAGPALRAVVLEAIHVLGAVGCAEDHEAPRHFRSVHADVVRFGGVRRARAELADYLLGPMA